MGPLESFPVLGVEALKVVVVRLEFLFVGLGVCSVVVVVVRVVLVKKFFFLVKFFFTTGLRQDETFRNKYF